MNFSNRTIRPKRASFSILSDPKVPAKRGSDRKGDNIRCKIAVAVSIGRAAFRADCRHALDFGQQAPLKQTFPNLLPSPPLMNSPVGPARMCRQRLQKCRLMYTGFQNIALEPCIQNWQPGPCWNRSSLGPRWPKRPDVEGDGEAVALQHLCYLPKSCNPCLRELQLCFHLW